MSGEIIKYEHGVFTNDGQSTVEDFANKLKKVADDIKQAGAITVYYGFHGDENGDLLKVFSDKELEQSLNISKEFPDVKMVKVLAPDDKNIDYKKHNIEGKALFTWCDSEKYIRNNKCLPDIVK
ncbi:MULTISPECIES: hypothetical protein [Pantoea]|uniref:hypothetical protein n=1 Tax=Pantoea TaxID=53335 RepID=UPI000CF51A36|nr:MULTISPECIES: hypothetical protein [Pantoea]MCH9299886.1 hypothetical protein [Pantoea allii]PQK82856.1 hypothetical protein CG432_22765 [Pantoea ananatis]PQK87833.1 hypothetical protein CG433_21940 [Pantoea ananatis]PWV60386.1 hypothetical protein C7425_11248 [Pantoea ananatis]PWV83866.1 hypothetical protein C7426_11254 [Pantoea ananatis]